MVRAALAIALAFPLGAEEPQPGDFSRAEPFEALAGGAATVPARQDAEAFSQFSATLDAEGQAEFLRGNRLFRKLWVAAPAVTRAADGLGPLYNARSCQLCHIRDGRGRPPVGGDAAVGLVLRLTVPGGPVPAGIEGYFAPQPEPVYGAQLQEAASAGQRAEGRLVVDYTGHPVRLADGEIVTLTAPAWGLADPAYGPLAPDVMLSPRVAPQMIGLGLLEAIPAAEILAGADPEDRDGDGISGRPNIVMSMEFGGRVLGRFGLKAGRPTIREQTAAAFSDDMGLATVLLPQPWGDCTPAQPACRMADHGAEPGLHDGLEVDAASLETLTFYARNLAVPERRDVDDPVVLRGKRVFHAARCAACHRPRFVTAGLPDQPGLGRHTIWPYSDLLLHDMGEGLADGRPEARATGQEWRTPPLWGIGLTENVSGHTRFLHDGRAGSLLEAIIWHGGEAEAAREAVIALPRADRAALIAFLESL